MNEKQFTNEEIKQQINDGKMELLTKLFNMYPYLETEKENIIHKCISNTDYNKHIFKPIVKKNNAIVLEQIIYDNNTYYKDKFGGVWDSNAELVGVIKNCESNNTYLCELFCNRYNTNIDLKNILDSNNKRESNE